MEGKEILAIGLSLATAFTLTFLLRLAFKTAYKILRLVFFLVLAAVLYVYVFGPGTGPDSLLPTIRDVLGLDSSGK